MGTPPQLLEREARRADPALLGPDRRGSRWSSSPLRAGSDRRLAQRASRGDRRAIAAIFERYRQELYGFCLGLLGEPQDAQDALQNTMVKVLRALPGEEREIALRPWLYRIAHNEAIELRRSRHPTQALDGYLVDGQSSVTERAEQREQLEWLLKDLADLPERQRTVLVMRELSGLDFAEIGAALDTSGAVVRQSLYEARRNLEQMDHGRGMGCEAVARVLSDADGRVTRRRDIRAHLRDCPDCQRFQDAIGRRRDVLAAVPPVPAAAAAGIAQAFLGGSSGAGTVAALTGGVVKSAGAYGVLKAAGTLATVAVVGTAAIQGEVRDAPPGPPSRAALAPARGDPSHPPSSRRVRAVRPAPAPSPRHPAASTADRPPSALVNARAFDRRPRSSPRPRDESLAVAATAVDPPRETSHAAAPAAPGPKAEQPQQAGAPPGQAKKQEVEKVPPGQVKKQEAEKLPAGQGKKQEAEKLPAGQAKKQAEAEKVPPGQAKKQEKAEAPAAPPPPPPPVEAAPAEAPQTPEGPESHGKAKGHEK